MAGALGAGDIRGCQALEVATVALMHSPLVGPSTWAAVADELARLGHQVVVPDLRHAVESEGTIDSVVAAAVEQLPITEFVLVGHSGSGVLLPHFGEQAHADVGGFVFVDAHLPPTRGSQPIADEGFREFLGDLASDGRLPPWSTWWGSETMAELVPDELIRHELSSEMPRVPLAYFDEQVTGASTWREQPCSYVRLSALYEDQARMASDMGWPIERFSAGHLHMVVNPTAVTRAILNVLATAG